MSFFFPQFIRDQLAHVNKLTYNQSSLETNTTGWAAGANTTIARTTAAGTFRDGVAALAITKTTSVGTAIADTPGGTSGMPVSPGLTYTAIADLKPATVGRGNRVQITYYNAAGTLISSHPGSLTGDALGTWVTAIAQSVAPALSAFARMSILIGEGAAAVGEVHYADKMSLREGTSVAWTPGWDVANLFPPSPATQTLGMALFYSAPAFVNNDVRYDNVKTLADLKALTGWTEAVVTGYPLSDDQVVSSLVSGGSTYVMLSDFPIDDDMGPVQVRAIAFFIRGTIAGVVNPIVFVTNTPISPVATLVGGDLISPVPDPALVGSNRWLFGWANSNPAGSLVEGVLAVQKQAPEFEPAHTQHIWMYPQRVNVIANPSFELGTNHWRSNGIITRIDSDVSEYGVKAGRFTIATGPLIVESNKFPGRISNDWTIRLLAQGNGVLKIGLLAWPVEFDETVSDWGPAEEVWELPIDGYAAITVLRSVSEIYEGQLRLETDGTELTLDQVIVEPGFLLDWPYFDGDTTYGARDDYSWYGGEDLRGETYSLFYNNKRATAGRLFATKFPDRAALTSEDELKEGLVYQWVPAGTLIEPHWDVLFEGDLQHMVPDVAGTAVTPYRTAAPGSPGYATDMGVNNPWDPEEPL